MAWTTPGTATAGEVLTAAFWNEQVRDNTDALYSSIRRLGYQQRTSNYAVNQTAIASAADVFASDITFTADGTSSYRVEVFFPRVDTGSASGSYIGIHLVDGSGTAIAELALAGEGTGNTNRDSVTAVFYYTPAAGSRSLNVRAVYGTAAGNLVQGTGTSGGTIPAFIEVTGPAIT